jgi:hypothetical protein
MRQWKMPYMPERFNWISPEQVSGLIFLRNGFVIRRLQIHVGYARGSLLALRKNLRRSRILPN